MHGPLDVKFSFRKCFLLKVKHLNKGTVYVMVCGVNPLCMKKFRGHSDSVTCQRPESFTWSFLVQIVLSAIQKGVTLTVFGC